MRAILTTMLLASLLAACSDSEGGSAPTDTPAPTETAGVSRCEEAPAWATAIGEGLLIDGTSVSKAAVVRSEDFDSVWFVAGEIDGPGAEFSGEGPVGLWATTVATPDESGLLIAVNASAKDLSDWGADVGAGSQYDFDLYDDGAAEALACL